MEFCQYPNIVLDLIMNILLILSFYSIEDIE